MSIRNDDDFFDHDPLSEEHRHLLEVKSAISPEVIQQRNYQTIREPLDPESGWSPHLQFKRWQWRIPGLLIPVYDVYGRQPTYLYRPDNPRLDSAGRPRKYEWPHDQRNMIDVPPKVQPFLGDPSKPLMFTEGVRKADAAVSAGGLCVSINGVWNWRGRNRFDGRTALTDFEVIALEDRTVFLVFDSDWESNHSVRRSLERLGALLIRRHANVRFCYLETAPDGTKVGLDDYLAAGGSGKELAKTATETIRGGRVVVVGTDKLEYNTAEVLEDMVKKNDPPQLFSYGMGLARTHENDEGRQVIREMDMHALRYEVERTMRFEKVVNKKTGETGSCPPPDSLLRDILSKNDGYPFPRLKVIIESPAMRPDGTVIDTPGFDRSTGLLFLPDRDLELPSIPGDSRIFEWRAKALEYLSTMLKEFPFTPGSYANYLAFLLTPVMRPTIREYTPLAVFDANQKGSGKGLLVNIASIIHTGRDINPTMAVTEEEEWRKKITTDLRDGLPIMFYDEVSGELRSSQHGTAGSGPHLRGSPTLRRAEPPYGRSRPWPVSRILPRSISAWTSTKTPSRSGS